MKKLVLLILLMPLGLFAVKAPDFTVTDYNNKTHKLFADYLNKEKVVVLKIFFVDCPPCNSIAPMMEPIYQKWGGGNGRVQFFELSTMSFDNNSYVKTYAQKYGITFPGVGSDGGSLAAVAPYKDNKTFGSWYGTPTFVVIAPNGEVNFNVPFGKSNTVSLDTAIAQALRIPSNDGGGGGGTKCTDSFQIKVYNQFSSKFTPKVVTFDLYNSSNPKYDLLNGLYNCEFFFPSIRDYYVVGLENIPLKGEDELNGISTQDIVILQKYILSIKPMNNLQLVLGDVNNNGVVSSSDISELRKLILGLTPTLKVGKYYGVAHNPKGFDNKGNSNVLVNDLVFKKVNNEFGIGHYGDVSGAEKIGFSGEVMSRTECSMDLNVVCTKTTSGFHYNFITVESTEFDGIQLGLKGDFEGCKNLTFNSIFTDIQYNGINFSAASDGNLFVSWSDPTKSNMLRQGDVVCSFDCDHKLNFAFWGPQEIILKDGSVCNLNFTNSISNTPILDSWFTSDEMIIRSSAPVQQIRLFNAEGQVILEKKFSGTETTLIALDSKPLPGGLIITEANAIDGQLLYTKSFSNK
ncbi:MAG: redoxin domain-containing protein [Saprospiraceae bacterium]|nr:redoxin domain-containing protein [Saprospiraceae bacterium]HMW38090.1 redoxin domain-containing protein [Saprospiraceae bacterium]HMX87143.1 redoxin domain-containing protein [Saprospiraceae bacterium]HMZ38777.1 redoxin domain-containing protein [Saprospiraceae bacterium]HNA63202.1 redoxin domain-containing protein [Saprospiraceae bacterium]